MKEVDVIKRILENGVPVINTMVEVLTCVTTWGWTAAPTSLTTALC